MLLVLAGCVSSDGPLTAQNLDNAGVTADSPAASALKEDASSADKANPEAKAAAAETKNETEGTADGAAALAIAAKTPQSPALAAANAAVSDTKEHAEAPTVSPPAEDESVQAAVSKTAMAGTDGAPGDVASSSADADGATGEAEQKQGLSLFHLFSSNRAGKQAHSVRSVSSRTNETATKTTQAMETAASAEVTASSDETEIDQIEVASVDYEHEEYEDYEPMESLPGVRLKSLYSFSQDGDADGQARIELASAAGMGRFSSGFLVKQRETVQTACLKPALLGLLKRVQYHFDAPVMITSGYRGKKHNRRVGGVSRSKHMTCEAADIQVEGVSKWQLAKYVRSIPGRGGVGTYCHTNSVHVDIGRKRDWNWRCRRGK